MYSKARIAGHPIHPMMIAFPIALYTATIAALLAYLGTSDPFYFRAAMVANIAGVVMALLAAVPGAIDLFALPKHSRARATGIKHGSFALLTTGLFAVSAALLWRSWGTRVLIDNVWQLDAAVPLAIDVGGLVTLVIVGALGWSMVQTHHVGIKPTFLRAAPPSRPQSEDFDDFSTPIPAAGIRHAGSRNDDLRH